MLGPLEPQPASPFPGFGAFARACRGAMETCHTLPEAFRSLYDIPSIDYECPPEDAHIEWPLASKAHSVHSFPPRVRRTPGPFKVWSRPELAEDTFAQFKVANQAAFNVELEGLQKEIMVGSNITRLAGFGNTGSVLVKRRDVYQFFERLTASLLNCVPLLVPVPFLYDSRTIKTKEPTGRPAKKAVAKEAKKATKRALPTPTLGLFTALDSGVHCFVRFLLLSDLDVSEEIQHLAQAQLEVTLDSHAVLQRQKPAAQPTASGRTAKATEILCWIFTAAHESNTPYVLVSDGLKSIWCHVHNGIISVGRTMAPSQAPADLDVLRQNTTETFGLLHALLAVAWAAGYTKLRNPDNIDRVLRGSCTCPDVACPDAVVSSTPLGPTDDAGSPMSVPSSPPLPITPTDYEGLPMSVESNPQLVGLSQEPASAQSPPFATTMSRRRSTDSSTPMLALPSATLSCVHHPMTATTPGSSNAEDSSEPEPPYHEPGVASGDGKRLTRSAAATKEAIAPPPAKRARYNFRGESSRGGA